MKGFLLSCALLFSSALAHADDLAIMGRWISPQPLWSNSVTSIFLTLEFQPGLIQTGAVCRYVDGKDLEVATPVVGSVENGVLTINQRAEKEIVEDMYACSVAIDPGSVSYEVVGGVLRVSAPGEPPLDFVRR